MSKYNFYKISFAKDEEWIRDAFNEKYTKPTARIKDLIKDEVLNGQNSKNTDVKPIVSGNTQSLKNNKLIDF